MLDAGERVDVAVGQEGAVVDARGAELDREPHAVGLAELGGVHPRTEPLRDAGLEDATALVHRERPALAEHVDPPRVGRARVEHLADHEVDVRVAVLDANSAGTTCAPRNVTSGVSVAASRTERSSSATERP